VAAAGGVGAGAPGDAGQFFSALFVQSPPPSLTRRGSRMLSRKTSGKTRPQPPPPRKKLKGDVLRMEAWLLLTGLKRAF